jgi:hypothetical protein
MSTDERSISPRLIAIEVSVKYTDLEAHSVFKAAG